MQLRVVLAALVTIALGICAIGDAWAQQRKPPYFASIAASKCLPNRNLCGDRDPPMERTGLPGPYHDVQVVQDVHDRNGVATRTR